MALQTTTNINVDFHDKRYIMINAKQYDSSSRWITITCYDNGNLLNLSASKHTTYIRYRKADGYGVLNSCRINYKGEVLVELTEQMLAADGICYVDLIIVNKGSAVVNIDTGEIVTVDGSAILSTMAFCINVYESTIDSSVIESSDEFNALNEALIQVNSDFKEVVQLAKSYAIGNANNIRENEDYDNSKYYSEQASNSADAADESEANALSYMNTAKSHKDDAETAQSAAETAQGKAEEAQSKSETAQQNAETAQSAAEVARSAAETAQGASEVAQGKAEEAQSKSEVAQSAAEVAQQKAETAQSNAETAQGNAETAQQKAEDSQSAAEAAQQKAETAQNAAETAQKNAEQAASEAAAQAAENAVNNVSILMNDYVTASQDNANVSKSYAIGSTGVRENEDTDNAKYYYELTKSVADSIGIATVDEARDYLGI